jgi:hypothetical protein
MELSLVAWLITTELPTFVQNFSSIGAMDHKLIAIDQTRLRYN